MFEHDFIEVPKLKQVTNPNERYYENSNGSRFPSITTVLGQTKDMTKLMEWKKRVGEEEANRISRKATTHGTKFHKECERYLLNEDFEHSLLFRAVRPTLDRIISVKCLETVLYSEYLGVAGTVDCIAEMDGELSVIDFKTSRTTKKEEWIDDYFIQAAFYFYAFYERTKILPSNTKIIVTTNDGKVQEFTQSARNNKYWVERLKTRINLYNSKREESQHG
jgi:genome maintenance exonuclease 1|tara:strand:- start:4943 stop:5605 length:663 start_codon:yes stop_codon:yes gene_type:complete